MVHMLAESPRDPLGRGNIGSGQRREPLGRLVDGFLSPRRRQGGLICRRGGTISFPRSLTLLHRHSGSDPCRRRQLGLERCLQYPVDRRGAIE